MLKLSGLSSASGVGFIDFPRARLRAFSSPAGIIFRNMVYIIMARYNYGHFMALSVIPGRRPARVRFTSHTCCLVYARGTLLDSTRGAPLDDGGGWRGWLTGWLEAEERLSEVRADEKSLTWSPTLHLTLSLSFPLFFSLVSFTLPQTSWEKWHLGA